MHPAHELEELEERVEVGRADPADRRREEEDDEGEAVERHRRDGQAGGQQLRAKAKTLTQNSEVIEGFGAAVGKFFP